MGNDRKSRTMVNPVYNEINFAVWETILKIAIWYFIEYRYVRWKYDFNSKSK